MFGQLTLFVLPIDVCIILSLVPRYVFFEQAASSYVVNLQEVDSINLSPCIKRPAITRDNNHTDSLDSYGAELSVSLVVCGLLRLQYAELDPRTEAIHSIPRHAASSAFSGLSRRWTCTKFNQSLSFTFFLPFYSSPLLAAP
jgi:hypothetical protein